MKTLTRDELEVLMQSQDGWCVSLYMPTHRTADGSHADQIRFKVRLRVGRSYTIA